MSRENQPAGRPEPLFLVPPGADDEPLAAQVERALAGAPAPADELALLTDVAQGDPYLAEQLATLLRAWEVRPPPARGLLGRVRTRLAWWLLEPELRQINAVHAAAARLAGSLVVLADRERAERRSLAARGTEVDDQA